MTFNEKYENQKYKSIFVYTLILSFKKKKKYRGFREKIKNHPKNVRPLYA